jgi:putative phosphoribosyl transferase
VSRVRFADRAAAGRSLAARLAYLRDEQVVVLGLPRGGVPVAFEVAQALGAPLDVILVRKIGVPFQPELAMGAIGENGVRVVNEEVVRLTRVSTVEFERADAQERAELERRALRFRGGRPPLQLQGRTAVIVDDGIATGSTARAACAVARAHGAARVVLAVPVAPPDWTARLADAADEYVALATPEPFIAVGQFYDRFTQTTDDEVVSLLAAGGGREVAVTRAFDVDVAVPTPMSILRGRLTAPVGASGMVLFAHGSGSGRLSPRNRFVATVLNEAGLGTLLFDLLTPEEETDRSLVFDVPLLAARLGDATRWLRARPDLGGLPFGYFGASTGAAAALWAAAEPHSTVAAVVSRGGRPDLAMPRLAAVAAPTLLIVGGGDRVVLELNRAADAELRGEHQLVVVPGATHLFEEPGALDQVARYARDWFVTHLGAALRASSS